MSSQWLRQGSDNYALTGELTRESVPALWTQLKEWKPESDTAHISLEETGRIDSSGMALLIHLIEHAKNLNCHIMLCFVPKELHTLFQLSNVESMMVEHIQN